VARKKCKERGDNAADIDMITRRAFLKASAYLGASLASFGVYAVGIEPLLRLSHVRYPITPKGWPADLKLRMVVLADIHASEPWMNAARIQSIVDQANALNGDIILLLGDYISGQRFFRKTSEPSQWAPILGQLKAPLGVHAIQGNHDWWEDKTALADLAGPTFVQRALEAAGINVLENDAVKLTHHGKPFWLAGLGDQLAFLPVRRRALGVPVGVNDMRKTLAKITDDAPAILMAHEPDVFPRVPKRFTLTLSGHTHGGQFNLFGWRPVAASHLSRKYPRGFFQEEHGSILVSSGIGCSIVPARFGVPPEIMIVELGSAA
jgi:uncharacterized protein